MEIKKNHLTFDEAINVVGSFGKFQKTLEVLLCVVIIFLSYQSYIMFFATLTPTWRCAQNSSVCLLKGNQDAEDLMRCHMKRDDWYYTQGKRYSLVTWFDIKCDDHWVIGATNTVFFFGMAIGSPLLGRLADAKGRKFVLILSTGMVFFFGFLTAFAPDMNVVLMCRFTVGFFHNGVIGLGVVLMMEVVGPMHRNIASLGPFAAFPIGYSMLAVQAYLIQDWRTLCIVITLPYFILIVFMLYYVPESPEWLQVKGKDAEALDILNRIARSNKTEVPQLPISSSPVDVNDDHPQVKRKKGPDFIPATLILTFFRCSSLACTYGIVFTAHKLPGDVHLISFLLNIFVSPSGFIAMVGCNKYGRKKTVLIPFVIVGCLCVAIASIPSAVGIEVQVALAIITKFLGWITEAAFALWSAELFETNVRATGLGIVEFTCRLSTGCFMLLFASSTPLWVVFTLLGVCVLAAFGFGLILPETMPRGTVAVNSDPDDVAEQHNMLQRLYTSLVQLRRKELITK